MKAYLMDEQEIIRLLKTNPTLGLTAQEVQLRFKEYGYNQLPYKKPPTYVRIFFEQFKNPLIYLLLVAATIIFFVESLQDTLFISLILLLNAFVGTYQEGKASNLLASLRHYIKTQVSVMRDGKLHIISSEEIVPGDMVILQEGDLIPANGRIIYAKNFRVNESAITGESVPVEKISEVLVDTHQAAELPIFEQKNMVFAGSYVAQGTAHIIVTATGKNTLMGHMQSLAESIEVDMPLKIEIDRIAYHLIWYVIGMCAALFLIGFAWGKNIQELLSLIAALFICVVPEGLPVIFTLVLAMGVSRMAQNNVLVKRLQAVEGLGQVDILAIDKTGTLTKNEMRVQKIFVDNRVMNVGGTRPDNVHTIVSIAALMSSALVEKFYDTIQIKGDPTEGALTLFANACGISKKAIMQDTTIIEEYPFDFEEKIKVTSLLGSAFLNNSLGDEKLYLIITGAPEIVLNYCTYYQMGTNVELLDSNQRKAIDNALDQFLQEGLRVIAAAYCMIDNEKEFFAKLKHDKNYLYELIHTSDQIVFVGLYGLGDTIRAEVVNVVTDARAQGLQIIMITGDHELTARRIGKESGILQNHDRSIIGAELAHHQEQKYDHNVTVYARVTPEQKLSIIDQLHKAGYIVAMTGDGVNDAISLAAADVGIAMGIIGTEVTKEAADIILLDDQLATIINGIAEGRHIFSLLRRVILYFFSTNLAEILVVLIAIVLNLQMPFVAIQILWINFITDGLLALALAMEPLEHHLIAKRSEHLVDKEMIGRMFILVAPMALGTLIVFLGYLPIGLEKARTMALMTLVFFQLWNAWNCRSLEKSIFKSGLVINWYLFGASCVVIVLQLMLVQVTPLQKLFHTVNITSYDWIIIIMMSSTIIWIEEARKWFSGPTIK